MKRCTLVLPSLKISGGTLELLRLAKDLSTEVRSVDAVSMWRSPHEVQHSGTDVAYLSEWTPRIKLALCQYPALLWRFMRFVGRSDRSATTWIFSHYATLPLTLFIPASRRWYFVQDMEWRFVRSRALSGLLKQAILFFYSRGRIISANAYLSSQLREQGLRVEVEAPIWADSKFRQEIAATRDVDLVMVLRKGAHKRLDLYLALLTRVRAEHPSWRVAIVTPEDHIAIVTRDLVALQLVRPGLAEMKEIYARSRCFVHLSEHEGFGLPPLEAMGGGCVPICRDSGGVRSYMQGELGSLLLPRTFSIEEILARIGLLLSSPAELSRLSSVAARIFVEGSRMASRRAGELRDTDLA